MEKRLSLGLTECIFRKRKNETGRRRDQKIKESIIKAKTKRKFRITNVQNSKAAASENILKQNFTASSENKIWTGDITCLWIKESWLYLAVVMDIYSRKIVLAGR